MQLQVQGASAVEVSDRTFGGVFNEALVHQVVTAYMAGQRSGTRGQKTRANVRGGGIKPWRQKGSGRARAGSIRSPLWRGGGKIFAATPQDHSQKVNRKMYQGALRAILSELVRQQRLVVVESFGVSAPKTRVLLEKLKALSLDNVLIITEMPDENLYLAARNVAAIDVCDPGMVDPINLIGREKVLMTVAALRELEGRLG